LPPSHSESARVFEGLLRGEHTAKEYADCLRREARERVQQLRGGPSKASGPAVTDRAVLVDRARSAGSDAPVGRPDSAAPDDEQARS
jgi:hypothetical protein